MNKVTGGCAQRPEQRSAPVRSRSRPSRAGRGAKTLLNSARVVLTDPRSRALLALAPGGGALGPPTWLVGLTFWLTHQYPSAAAIDRVLGHPVIWRQLCEVSRGRGCGVADWLPSEPVEFAQLARLAMSAAGSVELCRALSRLLGSGPGASSVCQVRLAGGARLPPAAPP